MRKKVTAMRQAVDVAYNELERDINENRLHSVESKVGPVTSTRIDEIAELLTKDALKDFIKDNEETWNLVEVNSKERIERNTYSKVRTFVANYVTNNNIA